MSTVLIQATVPYVIPAVAAKQCNLWGPTSINIGGLPNLNTSIEANKFHTDGTSITWSPEQPKVFNFPNLYEAAATRPRIQQIIDLLTEELADLLTEQGLI